MLSRPSFDDRTLAESFYQALLDRFCDSFDGSTRTLLDNCTFGIAPSQTGVKTFFILAPSLDVAKQLAESIGSIITQVTNLMPGVAQTAICVVPPETQAQGSTASEDLGQFPPKFMMGKIFSHPSEVGSAS